MQRDPPPTTWLRPFHHHGDARDMESHSSQSKRGTAHFTRQQLAIDGAEMRTAELKGRSHKR